MTILDLKMEPSLESRERREGTVTGKILDLGNKPVEATVLLTSKQGNVDLKTASGSDGRFQMKLPAGNYQLRVVAKGFISQSKKFKVENKSKVILNISM